MTLDIFKEVIRLLKEHSDKDRALYNLGVDLSDFDTPLQMAINHLIGPIYRNEGKETFDWWCYEKDWGTRTDLTMTDSENNIMCESIEDLHQYLEDTIAYDYELPKKYTSEESEYLLKTFLKK